MQQNRWRSKVVWVALVAVIGGVFTRYAPNRADDVVFIADAIITALTIVGILNNPTDKENF